MGDSAQRAAQRWLDNGGTLEALDAAPSTAAIKELVRHPAHCRHSTS
ncbi:MAG TPA: hypothetical protein VK659_30475 [Asanoa sp.]|nr:hypothetical protein [Asanoa sp.]